MENFIAFENENMGGCSTFEFIPVDDVVYIPDAVNNVIETAITLKTGKAFYTGLSVINTLKFTEDEKDTDAGCLFTTKIEGIIPKLTADYIALFSEMKNARFLLKISDNNGLIRLCGKKSAGMKFNFIQETGAKASDKNGFEFSFSLENSSCSPVYDI